jgi:hypothetical protein
MTAFLIAVHAVVGGIEVEDAATLTGIVPGVSGQIDVQVVKQSNSILGDLGVLEIRQRPSHTYADWIATQFLPGSPSTTTGTLADPDHDGLRNVIKYALNLSPTQSSLLDLGLVKNGATVTLQFPAPAHPDVNYTVKASDTLGS